LLVEAVAVDLGEVETQSQNHLAGVRAP
jgi:hypothetical protein